MRAKLYRGKWYAVWTDEAGQTRRQSLRTADRDIALRRLADALKPPKSTGTVAAVMEGYLAERQDRASHGRMLDAWKALRGTFGHLRPDQVTAEACREYTIKRRERGRQDGTIWKELSVLRTALRWADKNTPAVIALPPQPPSRDRHLTRDEATELLDACRAPHIRLFVMLALSTAGRKQAILDLTWDRVDFQRGIIRLSDGRQGGKGRATVPMTRGLRSALEAARKAAVSDYVVEYAGEKVGNIKRGFAEACERAGLGGDVTPHVLRHTAAVWMAEAGIPIPEIGQYLGHTDLRVTYRTYARYSPEHLKKAAETLEMDSARWFN